MRPAELPSMQMTLRARFFFPVTMLAWALCACGADSGSSAPEAGRTDRGVAGQSTNSGGKQVDCTFQVDSGSHTECYWDLCGSSDPETCCDTVTDKATVVGMRCEGACINTSSDTANCGACGHTCAGGEQCSNATCVPGPAAAGASSGPAANGGTSSNGTGGTTSTAPAAGGATTGGTSASAGASSSAAGHGNVAGAGGASGGSTSASGGASAAGAGASAAGASASSGGAGHGSSGGHAP